MRLLVWRRLTSRKRSRRTSKCIINLVFNESNSLSNLQAAAVTNKPSLLPNMDQNPFYNFYCCIKLTCIHLKKSLYTEIVKTWFEVDCITVSVCLNYLSTLDLLCKVGDKWQEPSLDKQTRVSAPTRAVVYCLQWTDYDDLRVRFCVCEDHSLSSLSLLTCFSLKQKREKDIQRSDDWFECNTCPCVHPLNLHTHSPPYQNTVQCIFRNERCTWGTSNSNLCRALI